MNKVLLLIFVIFVVGCSHPTSSEKPPPKFTTLTFPALFEGTIQCMPLYTDTSLNNSLLTVEIDRADSMLTGFAFFHVTMDTVPLLGKRVYYADTTYLHYRCDRIRIPDSTNVGWYMVTFGTNDMEFEDTNWPRLDNDYNCYALRTK